MYYVTTEINNMLMQVKIINRFQPKCYRGGVNYCALLCFPSERDKRIRKITAASCTRRTAQKRIAQYYCLENNN